MTITQHTSTTDMTHNVRKKALKYLMFLKEKEMEQSRNGDVQMASHKGYTQQKKIQAT